VVTGNIFCSRAQTCVNTINCVGVMGAGIAFEYRLRYPDMFQQYRALCEQGQFSIGKLWMLGVEFPDQEALALPEPGRFLARRAREIHEDLRISRD